MAEPERKKQPRTRSNQPSIKYRFDAAKGTLSELADFGCEECAPRVSSKRKQNNETVEPESVEILSTAELMSAFGQLWDRVDPLAILKHNGVSNSSRGCPREDVLGSHGLEVNGSTPTSADIKYFRVDLRAGNHFSHMVQPSQQYRKVSDKLSAFELCRQNYIHSTLQRFTCLPHDPCKGREFASLGISYELSSIYGWMSYIIPAGTKFMIKPTKFEKKNSECLIPGDTIKSDGCLPQHKNHSAENLATSDANCHHDLIRTEDSSSSGDLKLAMTTKSATSLYSDYSLSSTKDQKAFSSALGIPKAGLYADYHIQLLDSCTRTSEECQQKADVDELLEDKSKQYGKPLIKDGPSSEMCSPTGEKPQYTLAKQEHAFAGALAGICVSLCLHPVDTVKTVIQSCRAEQKSIFYIGRSVVSERGITGLYRGFTSNIASSAPISAIYTFTYESVKGALLPLLPKEHYSLAHCIAGGCASIATSFIFTPSERIKQQMQVGSHYHNCWNALVGIIGKGGLPSLYAGWGAVLCRNVPHSIIKFYTYESLKKLMLASQHSNTQPSALQTLLCGGLAGTTAALFTTPFDVVKTRLQTQIPGSRSQYHNVLHALQEIGKQEGLRGLYRGLIPRLVMYMSQGALFFSSYEFFKSLFSLGLQQRIQGQPTAADNATPTPTPSKSQSDPSPLSLASSISSPSPSSRRLHS